MLHLLSLVAALRLVSAPSACIMSNLTSNVTEFASIGSEAVAQTVAQQLRARGWTVYQTMTAVDGMNTCSADYIVEISASAVHTGTVYAFSLSVDAYEKMDSKHRQGWYYWASHYNSFGTWTAWDNQSGQGQSQLMQGVSQYVVDVASKVEQEPTN